MKATLFDPRCRREVSTGGDRLNLGARPYLEEGLSGPAPGVAAPLDKGVGRGNRDFGLHTRKSGGWYPKLHSKGDRPVAETGNELCAYSTHESCWFQEEEF